MDSVIRRNFWDEYNRVQADELDAINLTNVFRETCSKETFYKLVRDPRRLAYMLTEPHRDKVKSQYALDCVWDKIIALAKRDPEVNTKTGLPDSKVWDLQLKLFQFLEQQKHGSLIQRIKQETTNVNVAMDGKDLQKFRSVEEVDRRLAELEAQLQKPIAIASEPRLVLPIEQAHRDAKKAEVER